MATEMKFDVEIVPGWPKNIRNESNQPVPPVGAPVPPPPGGFREIGNIRWKNDDPNYCLIFNVTGSGQYTLCTPHTIMKIGIDIETGWPACVTDENGNPVPITTLAAEALAAPSGGFREVANLRWFQGSTCIVLSVIGGGQYLLCR